MIGVSTCERCLNEFKWKRCKTQAIPRFCCNECQWSKRTDQEIFDLRKKMFFERVIKNSEGCWGWNGGHERTGYAVFESYKKRIFAHVFSWKLYHGEIPKGKFVCHHCDIRECTNPEHLFLGSHQENMADMVKKNRQAKGSRNGFSKLKEDDVREIKKKLMLGKSAYRIADDYNVWNTCIYKIKSGESWKHIEV